MSKSKKNRRRRSRRHDRKANDPKLLGNGLAVLKKYPVMAWAVFSAIVFTPMILPVLTEWAKDRYIDWKQFVPRFQARFVPVATSTSSGNYYRFDYTLTAENRDLFGRAAKDVAFVISAPAGCTLGPAEHEASPAGMEPLIGITTSKLPAQPLDEDEWKIARLNKSERVVIHYTIGCVDRPVGGGKPVVCVGGENCSIRATSLVAADKRSTVTKGPLVLGLAEAREHHGGPWKQRPLALRTQASYSQKRSRYVVATIEHREFCNVGNAAGLFQPGDDNFRERDTMFDLEQDVHVPRIIRAATVSYPPPNDTETETQTWETDGRSQPILETKMQLIRTIWMSLQAEKGHVVSPLSSGAQLISTDHPHARIVTNIVNASIRPAAFLPGVYFKSTGTPATAIDRSMTRVPAVLLSAHPLVPPLDELTEPSAEAAIGAKLLSNDREHLSDSTNDRDRSPKPEEVSTPIPGLDTNLKLIGIPGPGRGVTENVLAQGRMATAGAQPSATASIRAVFDNRMGDSVICTTNFAPGWGTSTLLIPIAQKSGSFKAPERTSENVPAHVNSPDTAPNGTTVSYTTHGTGSFPSGTASNLETGWEGMRVTLLNDGGANLRVTASSSPIKEAPLQPSVANVPTVRSSRGVTAAILSDGGAELRLRAN